MGGSAIGSLGHYVSCRFSMQAALCDGLCSAEAAKVVVQRGSRRESRQRRTLYALKSRFAADAVARLHEDLYEKSMRHCFRAAGDACF
eukprot:6213665-Pleurochrysis_carterae.AAC.2